MLLKLGSTGPGVREIRKALGITDGDIFDIYTDGAVRRYQKDNGLLIDGIVGNKTYGSLVDIDTDRFGFDDSIEDTDGKINYLGTYDSSECLVIDRAYLDTDEYVRDYGKIEPLGIILHHTAGWDNPYKTITSWNNDKRGRVATQYVIGGLNINEHTKHDGTVVECFPDGYLGWHTGKVGGFDMSKLSVGIELNNFGYLNYKNGKYYNYVGGEVPKNQVCDLGYEFRGHRYWHRYSENQIYSLRLLIDHILSTYPTVNISKGLPSILNSGIDARAAFEFNKDAYYARTFGLWTHSNIRKDKSDCFPQPELVQMINDLYNDYHK